MEKSRLVFNYTDKEAMFYLEDGLESLRELGCALYAIVDEKALEYKNKVNFKKYEEWNKWREIICEIVKKLNDACRSLELPKEEE